VALVGGAGLGGGEVEGGERPGGEGEGGEGLGFDGGGVGVEAVLEVEGGLHALGEAAFFVEPPEPAVVGEDGADEGAFFVGLEFTVGSDLAAEDEVGGGFGRDLGDDVRGALDEGGGHEAVTV
jgi:hypothetical protein